MLRVVGLFTMPLLKCQDEMNGLSMGEHAPFVHSNLEEIVTTSNPRVIILEPEYM